MYFWNNHGMKHLSSHNVSLNILLPNPLKEIVLIAIVKITSDNFPISKLYDMFSIN